MKLPQQPPNWEQLLSENVETVFSSLTDPDVQKFVRKMNDRYMHWDRLRHFPLPERLDAHEQAWAAVKVSRSPNLRSLPISQMELGSKIKYWSPPAHLEWLHQIDQQGGGSIGAFSDNLHRGDERYLISSLMEEAISSSMLEGASTTHKKAKALLRSNRKPKTKSERMIFNNYLAIHEIRDRKDNRLTPSMLLELQEILTNETLGDPNDSGRFRSNDDEVTVRNRSDGTLLFTPPLDHVEERVQEICNFANSNSTSFVHPVIKAIVLHYAIGYVHPFPDGNGRTARAVFYWYMHKHGYWLFQYLPISRIVMSCVGKYKRAYLYSESDDGDVTYFIHFHLRVIVRAIKELHDYLAEKQEEIRRATDLLKSNPGLNHRQVSLLTKAVKEPDQMFTISHHASVHRVTYPTSRTDLLDLEKRGFLMRTKSGRQLVFFPVDNLVECL